MTQTGAWRLSYTPGTWLVLAGPTSVVILQPASPQWSELVKTIWEDVLASASIHDLAARMSAFSLDDMPSFGAFFWTADGMRSLVRGGVVVVDHRNGTTVADGRGVLTWNEVGLGHLEQVRVDLGPQPADPQLVLPLVVGAVSAGSVLLDASAAAVVPLVQGAYETDFDTAAEHLPAAEAPAEVAPDGDELADPELPAVGQGPPVGEAPGPAPMADPFAADVAEPADEPEPAVPPAEGDPDGAEEVEDGGDARPGDDDRVDDRADDAVEDDDDDDDWEDTQFDLPVVPADATAPMPVSAPGPVGGPGATASPAEGSDDARTMFASSLPGAPSAGTIPPQAPPAPVRPVLAVLRVSTGGRADVDRPVLIGRSPIASRVKGDQLPRLLTVPSPSHDISRTHIEVAPQDGRVVVTDLNSTNGTVLVRPGSKPVDLQPGTPTPVEAGSLIDLGDGVTIAVDRT